MWAILEKFWLASVIETIFAVLTIIVIRSLLKILLGIIYPIFSKDASCSDTIMTTWKYAIAESGSVIQNAVKPLTLVMGI
jgi:hypothetical protein